MFPLIPELPKDSSSVPSNKEEEEQPASMAVLPTDKDGDLLLQTLHNAKSISSKPMLIPRGREEEEDNVIDTGPSSLGPGNVVVCVDVHKCGGSSSGQGACA